MRLHRVLEDVQRTLLLIVLFSAAGVLGQSPATTRNDDSCDIGVAPAATLLLPYFEVDVQSAPATAQTTLFTIVNTSQMPQIAKITLWTDWAYPALTFSAYVTGYGVASINLSDVLVRGSIRPGVDPHELPGSRSTFGNPNHLPGADIDCTSRSMSLSDAQRAEVVKLLTIGQSSAPSCKERVGGTHANAIGYATIDVVATCSPTMPTESAYYAGEILFDNVLIGDWEVVYPNTTLGNYAGGNPLVSLRAIPEGGPAGSNVATYLPYTFYDRYTTVGGAYARTVDRRQPLPSTFAARYIQGGSSGFDTSLVIWREGYTGAGAPCARYADNAAKDMTDLIRFDEHENAITLVPPCCICTPPPFHLGPLPATSSTPTSSYIFPGLTASGDLGGWMYLNTSNSGSPVYSTAPGRDFKTGSSTSANCSRQSQGWVSILMRAEGRYAVLFDGVPLGNGCSISPAPGTPIGPAPNVTP
jgi:hypothetical protein